MQFKVLLTYLMFSNFTLRNKKEEDFCAGPGQVIFSFFFKELMLFQEECRKLQEIIVPVFTVKKADHLTCKNISI